MKFMGFEAKAPGKVLWLGGYSVLERPNVGYVTAIDAYVHADVNLLEGDSEIHIKAPDFNLEKDGTLDPRTGKIYIERVKELNLLITTAEISLSYVISKGFKPEGIRIETMNDKAFAYRVGGNGDNKKVSKSGMGSSSAVTVALAAAILRSYGLDVNENDALHKIAQLSHSVATGKVGSGFDIAAATYGSIIYTRYSPSILSGFPSDFTPEDVASIVKKNWDYKIEKVALPNFFGTSMANFVNEAAITTSMVGIVNEFKKKNPEKYAELIAEMNETATAAVESLSRIKSESENEIELFVENFERNRIATKRLGELSGAGIEDAEATKLIEESKNNGALIAKLPGAGGRDSIVAISANGSDLERLRKFWGGKENLELLDISMQNNGVIISKKDLKDTSKSM
jgi:phosphomevalonate kinase